MTKKRPIDPTKKTSAKQSRAEFSWPTRIVSGGQTGVDRAALEVAIALGIEHGGWCPRGRLAEDGTVPSKYQLEEMSSRDYAVRTRQNVIDSDATLILYEHQVRGGTLLTRRVAAELGKPHLCLRINPGGVLEITQWVVAFRPLVLNIAGPRESTHPGIESRAFDFLLTVFT